MPKTATIFARVEPQLKEDAEVILNKMHLSMSSAVSMFLTQVVLQERIPFELTTRRKKPLCLDSMTDDEFKTEMTKRLASMDAGNAIPLDEFELKMKREFGL